MDIYLPPRLEALIRDKIARGRYNDASEVVREALQLLDARDRYDAFRAAILEGYEEAERGELIPYTPELFEEIKAQAREARDKGRPIDPLVWPE